jgi:hypothetical protein
MKNLRWFLLALFGTVGWLPLHAWSSIEWSSAPGEAGDGQEYFIQAHGWSDNGSL